MYPYRSAQHREQQVFARRRVLGSGIAAGAGAVALAACGASDAGAPAANLPPVTLNFLIKSRSSPAAEDVLRKLFADQNQQNPKTQVNIELVAGDAVLPQLTTRAASGQPQDFVESGGFAWVGMAEQKYFTELTPLFKRDKIEPAKMFFPEAVSINSKEGKLWGWPSSVSADAIAYNMDLFDAAGLKYPPVNPDDTSWTMEKVLEYAQKLTKGREQLGIGNALGLDFWTAGTFFGQGPWDDTARKAQTNTPDYIKGLQYALDLRDKHRFVPTADESRAFLGGQSGAVFFSGKIGMQGVGPLLVDKPSFRWGLATLPYSGTGKNISGRQWAHGIFVGSVPGQRAESIWQVLRWLGKPEHAGRYVVQNGHAVSALAQGGSDYPQQAYLQRSGADAKAYVLSAQRSRASGWGLLNYANYNDVDREHQPLWADLVAARMSVGEYAQRASDLWNRGMGKK
ncbi:MAG TPA: extracellular solute-binding protein [Chloroflexota bacterium]|nr:extracellular solute-binding protein [Chloroflexota bacterium]